MEFHTIMFYRHDKLGSTKGNPIILNINVVVQSVERPILHWSVASSNPTKDSHCFLEQNIIKTPYLFSIM